MQKKNMNHRSFCFRVFSSIHFLLQHDNLRGLIAHGLQCVVKNKHSTAEIILTQALFLPDFQRIELKAFVYICLAVVAYRRHKAG